MSQVATAVEGERVGRCGDPCVMVIFGAAGDLTRRKLIPSLYNLAKYKLLSREFAVIGIARNRMSTDEFRAKLVQDLKEFVDGPIDADLQEWFERHVFYITGEFADQSTYDELKKQLKQVISITPLTEIIFITLLQRPISLVLSCKSCPHRV